MDKLSKPRLKSFVEYYHSKNNIYFLKQPGVAIQLSDSDEFVYSVCQLMDGNKTIDDLKKIIVKTHPNKVTVLSDLLRSLDNEYLLEDYMEHDFENLSDYDIERWSRNIEFFGAYTQSVANKFSFQEKLIKSKVALLGLGGIGSHVLYNLLGLGIKNIKIVDHDKIELSNLNRQILYNEADIGEYKVDAADNRIRSFYPNACIESFKRKLLSTENIEEIIHDCDIVISAIDQPRDKIIDWVNLACVKHSIPFICGALDYMLATFFCVIPGVSGCVECWKLTAKKTKPILQELIQNKKFISAPSLNVATIPFISIVSGLIANEALKILTGLTKPLGAGRLSAYDFVTGQIINPESWEKHPNCSLCQ